MFYINMFVFCVLFSKVITKINDFPENFVMFHRPATKFITLRLFIAVRKRVLVSYASCCGMRYLVGLICFTSIILVFGGLHLVSAF